MSGIKRTKPNKKKPEACEAKGCLEKPETVLGGYWFCDEHGNRDYEKTQPLPVCSNSLLGGNMVSPEDSRITELEEALRELVCIVEIHQRATKNKFAWAELNAAKEALEAS